MRTEKSRCGKDREWRGVRAKRDPFGVRIISAERAQYSRLYSQGLTVAAAADVCPISHKNPRLTASLSPAQETAFNPLG